MLALSFWVTPIYVSMFISFMVTSSYQMRDNWATVVGYLLLLSSHSIENIWLLILHTTFVCWWILIRTTRLRRRNQNQFHCSKKWQYVLKNAPKPTVQSRFKLPRDQYDKKYDMTRRRSKKFPVELLVLTFLKVYLLVLNASDTCNFDAQATFLKNSLTKVPFMTSQNSIRIFQFYHFRVDSMSE